MSDHENMQGNSSFEFAVSDLIESEEETIIKKFEKLKQKAVVIRDFLDLNHSKWAEWQVMNGGPIFYSMVDDIGGQWISPETKNDVHQGNNSASNIPPNRDDFLAQSFTESPSLYEELRYKNLRDKEEFQNLFRNLKMDERSLVSENRVSENRVSENGVSENGKEKDFHFSLPADDNPEIEMSGGYGYDYFYAMYSTSSIVLQRLPWMCLLDNISNQLYFRNEVEDYFQFEIPTELKDENKIKNLFATHEKEIKDHQTTGKNKKYVPFDSENSSYLSRDDKNGSIPIVSPGLSSSSSSSYRSIECDDTSESDTSALTTNANDYSPSPSPSPPSPARTAHNHNHSSMKASSSSSSHAHLYSGNNLTSKLKNQIFQQRIYSDNQFVPEDDNDDNNDARKQYKYHLHAVREKQGEEGEEEHSRNIPAVSASAAMARSHSFEGMGMQSNVSTKLRNILNESASSSRIVYSPVKGGRMKNNFSKTRTNRTGKSKLRFSSSQDFAAQYACPDKTLSFDEQDQVWRGCKWTVKRLTNIVDLYSGHIFDSKELLRRLHCFRVSYNSNGNTSTGSNINIKQTNRKRPTLRSLELQQPALLKRMSKKKLLETQALEMQIALHEWFQQLQRCRDIIHECLINIDVREETWLEHEIAQRHLLEASVMQRNALVMPHGHRSMRAYPTIPVQLLNPSLTTSNLLDGFLQFKFVEYREKDDWEIYTHKDLISSFKYRLFRHKSTGVTQCGEPFSVRMKRIRESILKESWYDFKYYLTDFYGTNKVPNDLDLLSDEFGGLLFYHPNSDLYSASCNHDLKYVQPYPFNMNTRDDPPLSSSVNLPMSFSKKISSLLGYDTTDAAVTTMRTVPLPRSTIKRGGGYSHEMNKDNSKDIQASKVINFPIHNVWSGIPFVDIVPIPNVNTDKSSSSQNKGTVTGPSQFNPSNNNKNDNNANNAFSVQGKMALLFQKNKHQSLLRSMDAFESSIDDADEYLMYAKALDSLTYASPGPGPNTSTGIDMREEPSFFMTTDDNLNIIMDTPKSPQQVQFETPQKESGSSKSNKNYSETLKNEKKQTLNPLEALDFESRMPLAFLRQYRDLLLSISQCPTNPVFPLELTKLLLDEGLGKESYCVYQYAIDLLSSHPFGKQTIHDASVSYLLAVKLAFRYDGQYNALNLIQAVLKSCPESCIVLTHAAMYFHKVKYMDYAEQLFIGALMLDPLYPEALRGYAHVLIAKGDVQSALRYLNRIANDKSSLLYQLVRTEIVWLYELIGSEDEALTLAYTNLLSTQVSARSSIRATSLTLHSYGHFYHIRGDLAKAAEMYKRSLTYVSNNSQALLLLGCLGASDPTLLSLNETDSAFRRGLFCQWYHSSTRWIALLSYGEFLLSHMKDTNTAEHFLWEAYRHSASFTIWPTIALAHYFQYIRNDVKRAKKILTYSLRMRNVLSDEGQINIELTSKEQDDDSIGMIDYKPTSGLKSAVHANHSAVTKARQKDEIGALLAALAYCYLDLFEDANAIRFATAAIELDKYNTAAHRCLGIIAWNSHHDFLKVHSAYGQDQRRYALQMFSNALQRSRPGDNNPYTLRVFSIIMALQGKYDEAYKSMELAIRICPNSPLAFRALGVMSYLYKKKPEEAVELFTKAFHMSNKIDIESCKLKGQILLELGRYEEARLSFQEGLIVTPADSTLLANLALSLSALGHGSSIGINGDTFYNEKLASISSLRHLIECQDADELFHVAIFLGRHQHDIVQEDKESYDALEKAHRVQLKPQVINEIKYSFRRDDTVLYQGISQETLYLYGMYHVKINTPVALTKAKELFQETSGRNDVSPHPLALYMIGWLTELEGNFKLAEQYYCISIQLEGIELVDFLRLLQVVEDTLNYLKGLLQIADRSESSLSNSSTSALAGERINKNKKLKVKSLTKKQNTAAGFLVHNSHHLKRYEGANNEFSASEIRERLILHERVHKLCQLRKMKLGNFSDQLHLPKKFVNIDPLWLERLLHAFSICDDWSWLLRSSSEFRELKK